MTDYIENSSIFRDANYATAVDGPMLDRVLDEMERQWRTLMNPSTAPATQKRMAECMNRWADLLGRPAFASAPKTLESLGGWLSEWPEGLESTVLLEAAFASMKSHVMTPTARERLVKAAARRTALGLSQVLNLALVLLPESLEPLLKHLVDLRIKKSEVVTRYLERIRTCGSAEVVKPALRALFADAFIPFAKELLPTLHADDEVWQALGHAALLRPALHGPIIEFVAGPGRDRLEPLRPYLSEMARSGTLETETCLKPILANGPDTPRSDDFPPPLWTSADRRLLSNVLSGGTPSAEVIESLKRLVTKNERGCHDLVADWCTKLASRLGEPNIADLFVEVCILSHRRSSFLVAVHRLLDRLSNDPAFALSERSRLGLLSRLDTMESAEDTRLPYTRLGLPHTYGLWVVERKRYIESTEVEDIDLALALRYAGDDPRCLEHIIASSTPNQRRLLLKRARLDHFPSALELLLRTVAAHDPGALPPLISRIEDLRPEGFVDHLVEFVSTSELAPSVPQALALVVAHGRPHHLEALGQAQSKEVAATRRHLVSRLKASGEKLDIGKLALATSGGDLALSNDVVPDPIHEETSRKSDISKSEPSDHRQRLVPPPRKLGLHVTLAHLLLCANGWGLLWLGLGWLGALLSLRANLPLRNAIDGFLWFLLPYLACHFLGSTLLTLRALRRGTLLLGSVSVKTVVKKSVSRKGSTITQFHHTVTLLDDSGKTRVHNLIESRRLDRFLDEAYEPVLVLFDPTGTAKSLVPLDPLRIAKVSARGRFVLTGFGWFGLITLTLPMALALLSAII